VGPCHDAVMPESASAEAVARELLTALQDAVAAKDLDKVSSIFDDDVAVFGTGSANLDRAESIAYLTQVLAQDGVIRWDWVRVRPLVSTDDVLCFAVVGTVGLDGWAEADRDDFRLTCVAVKDKERWRLRHFHGSVPQRA
jgi:uncharacterized protein (TIGR02246 family)